jgi:hypothetical protein
VTLARRLGVLAGWNPMVFSYPHQVRIELSAKFALDFARFVLDFLLFSVALLAGLSRPM